MDYDWEREAARVRNILQESISAQKEDFSDVCCPLPFSLQDLCLLVVINDLGWYQVKLLASLPQWLRHRLLSILPALDLCRLERTPVATGVDVDVIWNSRLTLPGPSISRWEGWQSTGSFQLDLRNFSHLGFHRGTVLLKEIKSAFQGLEECKLPCGKNCLLEMASGILTQSSDLNVAANKLISIQGDVVFSNLLTGSMHQPSLTCECSQRVWKKQATALAVNMFSVHCQQHPSFFRLPYGYAGGEQARNVQLTPHHLLPILDRHDPLELLTLLTRDCSLQPSSANVPTDSISQSFLLDLSAERLALDSGFSLPPDSHTCTSIVNNILGKVIVLRLQCDDYNNIGVMIGMIKAAIVDGADSQLKHLFCTMPNIYMDTVQPLSALFSLQNFQQLTLEVDTVYPLMLSKLLQGFMTVSCPHTHKLMILAKRGMVLSTSLKTNQLAALDTGSVPSPSCSAENKILEFSSQKEFTSALYLLLQLPTVRLREIALVNLSEYYQYLHLCAIHPDLQTTKLVIDIGTLDSSQFLATIHADLVSLFKMASLRKIFICGSWGRHMEVKDGLVQGLHGRSCLSPLRKLVLELEFADSYEMSDLQKLSDAIFSLPRLENLKVVLGRGFVDMIQQQGFEEILYKSWIHRASKVKLKSICLQTYETKFEQLSLVTQKLSFYLSRKTYSVPMPTSQWITFPYDNTPPFGGMGKVYQPYYQYGFMGDDSDIDEYMYHGDMYYDSDDY